MKRIDDDTIQLTQAELNSLEEFIWDALWSQWDHYTDHVISSKEREEGMRSMNETMFDLRKQMIQI